MGLSIYRSCSWQEKRQVLDVFWRPKIHASSKINMAALEYGPYAILCILVIALELVPVIVYAVDRGNAWGWLAVIAEALTLLSLWWAYTRNRNIKAEVMMKAETETMTSTF
jgi:hypothetical protein